LFNFIYGILYMKESLDKKNKISKIDIKSLNPFTSLAKILSIKNLKMLFLCAFLVWIPNGAFQGLFSQFTINTFNFTPFIIGLLFSILGLQDILSQSIIMPKLINKFTDKTIILIGMLFEISAYIFIILSAFLVFYPFFIIGMFLFGFGDSIFGTGFNGKLSKSVDSKTQGKAHGASQSIQSLARIIGPTVGGQMYTLIGHTSFAFLGVIFIFASFILMTRYNKIL
ncbi:MAG: MFS transporter, partial [Sarcina sp.]